MSNSPRRDGASITPHATNDDQADEFTRRSLIASAVVSTALAAVGTIETPALAHSVDPDSSQDMVAFLLLSSALTGITIANLAPGFRSNASEILNSDVGSDPTDIKRDYFEWVYDRHAAAFETMLQIAIDSRKSPTVATDIRTKVNANDDTKYLGRSIVLIWYLGSWYEPADLAQNAGASDPTAFVPSKVISAKAYTQGRVWQIAQAHPMGYSELQFGYWSRKPVDPNDPTSPLGLITPKSP